MKMVQTSNHFLATLSDGAFRGLWILTRRRPGFNAQTQQACYIWHKHQYMDTDILELYDWRCNAMRHAHCHSSYIKLTRMSHRPLYHYTTVDLYVYRRDTYASASLDLGGKKERRRKAVPHFFQIIDVAILKSDVAQKRSWRVCRYVTVGVSSSCGFAPMLRRATDRWQEMPYSFLRVVSTASLCGL